MKHCNMLEYFKNLLKRKPRFFFIADGKYKVIEAFTFAGKKYYTLDNIFELPTGRGFMALTYYDELQMRASREYLIKHCKAVDILLSDPKKIDIGSLAIIHRNLKDRLELLPIPEHVYKLASVIFFDDSESPYTYDMTYNQKKIAKWKEEPDVLAFFLQVPMKNLLPYSKFPVSDIQKFSELVEELDRAQQSDISEIISRRG